MAIAGHFSAVYPRSSPGGWQLIGHTGTVMWDLNRDNPALIRPQDRIRFVPARESIAAGSETAALPSNEPQSAQQSGTAGNQHSSGQRPDPAQP